MMTRRAIYTRRAQLTLLWCLCAGALAGCYRPTHYTPHRGYFERAGKQPRMVRWGEKRWVQARSTRDGGRRYEVMAQPMCRRFEAGRVRLVDRGGASKKSPFDGWVTLTTLSVCGGGALLGASLNSDSGGGLAAAGAGLILAPLTGMLIYNLIPDYRPAQRQRRIAGGQWGKNLVPCGRPYRVRTGIQVNARSPNERRGVQWYASSGQVSLSGSRRDALKKWSAACRHTSVEVVAKATRRPARRSQYDRYSVLSRRGSRYRRYGLAGYGIEPGQRAGRPVKALIGQRYWRERLPLRPRDGVNLPTPTGAIGSRVRQCEAARTRRIARSKQKEQARCVARYRSQLHGQCAADCREAGDAQSCQWEREDCALLAEGTSVNCHALYNRCLEREGLTSARVNTCARSCADQISRRTCALKARAAEAAARQSEAIR